MKNPATAASAIALAATMLIVTPAQAEDPYIQINTGIDYSSGDYGDVEDTDYLSVPVGIKYQADRFYVKAAISYVHAEGPSGVIPGEGGGTSTPGGATTSRSGLGDLWLTAGYSLPIAETTWFDFVGKAKLPTASESKFLGTGSTDFTAQGELLHSFGDVSIAAYGGRRFNGKSDILALRDVWQAGGGIYFGANDLTIGLD